LHDERHPNGAVVVLKYCDTWEKVPILFDFFKKNDMLLVLKIIFMKKTNDIING
jgi:hypothetical protein